MAIHQTGKIAFFSGKLKGKYASPLDALKSHLAYITRYGYTNLNDEKLQNLLSYASERLAKRKDARFAVKTFFCLPNYLLGNISFQSLEKWITNFLASHMKLDPKDVILAFHPEPENFHVHVLAPSRDRQGKPLEYKPDEIRELHIQWDKFLVESLGAEVNSLRAVSRLLDEPIRFNFPNSVYKKEKSTLKALSEELKRGVVMEIAKRQEEQVRKLMSFLFNPTDEIFIVAINPKTGKVRQEKKYAGNVAGKMLSYLRSLNANGYNIYFSLNSFKKGSLQRIAENVEELTDKLYFDVDGDKLGKDGWEFWKEVMERYGLPQPSVVIRTSQKNIQVIYKLKEKVERKKLEVIMKAINKKLGLDATQDASRVFRLPGFKDRKRDRDFVKLEDKLSTFQALNFETFILRAHKLLTELKEERERETLKERETKIENFLTETERYLILAEKWLNSIGIIDTSLRNIKKEKQFDESVVDWAFSREILRHSLVKEKLKIDKAMEKTKHELEKLVLTYRPEKLQRSPEYGKITVNNALVSLEKELKKIRPDITTYIDLHGLREEEEQEKKDENENLNNFPRPP